MDCKKVQRLIQDLGDGRLDGNVARDVQRHLRECSDCRVSQSRALHLQQLFTVKRNETPGSDYFDTFLGEFQRRVADATAPRPTLWQRICACVHIEPVPRLRYGFTHALGLAFAVALMWRGLIASDLPATADRSADNEFISPRLATSSLPAPHSTPEMIASALPVRAPLPTENSWFVLPVLTTGAEFDAPRYILDRFNLTPASYEVASIHF